MHLGMHTLSRRSAEVQTGHQNGEEKVLVTLSATWLLIPEGLSISETAHLL